MVSKSLVAIVTLCRLRSNPMYLIDSATAVSFEKLMLRVLAVSVAERTLNLDRTAYV